MKADKNKIWRVAFYGIWLVAALLQARYTELFNDEAYYWTFSSSLDWGYFDHPPMVALLIKAGYFFFHNELGVRLIFVMMELATLWLLERLVKPANLKLFFIVVASVAVLHLGGMLALPDIPLLFFSVLFFHAYKRYTEYHGWANAVHMGVAMGLMLLSKYHGVLIIAFTLLSNLKLLRKGSFWLAILICFLMLIPHLLWQIDHDFPTLRFHLFERSSEGFSIINTLMYLVAQPFVFGPFIGVVLLYTGFAGKTENMFERTLKFNLIGIYAFFLLMTIKGRVEAHWTLCSLVPLLYLGYGKIENSERLKRFAVYSFPFALFLIIIVRVFMVWDFTPRSWKVKTGFHHYRDWAQAMDTAAKSRPVAFMNSYQKAAKFEFYTGHAAFSLNNVMGRKNQYTIWDSENNYQGKEIMLLPNYYGVEFHNLHTDLENCQYTYISNFRSYSNVKVTPGKSDIEATAGKPFSIKVSLSYCNKNIRDFSGNKELPSFISFNFFKGKHCVYYGVTGLQVTNDMLMVSDDFYTEWEVSINAPKAKGTYELYISIKTGWLPPTINGDAVRVEVK